MKYSFYLFAVILIGCDNNSEQNINSQLLGKWETQACQEKIDSNLNPAVTYFLKATYEFLENGDIVFSPNSYTDSTCSVIAFNTISPNSPIATFLDLGETILEEGISGNKLNIKIQTTNGILSTDGFYTINNNVLCFSRSYEFEPTSFSVSLNEIAPIDFTKCLEPRP